MEKLKVEYIDTGELKPYENNAKIHTDAQIEQIAKSIQEFGMNDPIAVWKDNEIIEGHGRLLACQLLGIQEVPIIRLDGLTDEQRRAYMNVHNQLTMNTGFDIDLLAEELGRIENIDMSLFGFDVDDLIEEQQIDEENAEAENATENLPDSKVYVCAVSVFGTNSEGIVMEVLKQDTADKILKVLQESGGVQYLRGWWRHSMLFDETERAAAAWKYYDELLEDKLNRVAELAGVDRQQLKKLNPAEFIEKNRFQRIQNYKYINIKKWIAENKTDDTFLVSPLDADTETAEQISYKARAGVTRKIRASKCEIVPVPKELALDFCVRNHRQSLPMISVAAVYLGLRHKGELVALMGYDTTSGAVRGSKEGYELVRLAIAKGAQVHGGASKLQTACEDVLRQMGIKKIFSYSNATINNGGVYKQLGFSGGKLDEGQPFVIMRDYKLIRLANLHPYSTDEELALRHQFKSHVGGNKMWIKNI